MGGYVYAAGNGWDFLAGIGTDLSLAVEQASCLGNPLDCLISSLGGTSLPQQYMNLITSQGIDTTSGAYFSGTPTGNLLLAAADGGAAGTADAGTAAASAPGDSWESPRRPAPTEGCREFS
jgi:sugar/nucleoside kinase (ribokinase family)